MLLVGLGNPGTEHEATRHNVGFRILEMLGVRHRIAFRRNRWRGQAGRGRIADVDVMLLKPQTYMNESGFAVRAVVAFHRIEPATVLVVHDDLDLPLGRLRFRSGGGAGGNNGIRSLISHLQTDQFARLKCGIGRPGFEGAVDHVLSPFHNSESEAADAMVARAADAVETYVQEGFERAAGTYNSG
ncbi:MAG: aminoacyl-tRNA hydrolase [Chloroflexi bacterium]|nr:aminoacyl-tRNA hydrolase [Chloroflexota bacterium]